MAGKQNSPTISPYQRSRLVFSIISGLRSIMMNVEYFERSENINLRINPSDMAGLVELVLDIMGVPSPPDYDRQQFRNEIYDLIIDFDNPSWNKRKLRALFHKASSIMEEIGTDPLLGYGRID